MNTESKGNDADMIRRLQSNHTVLEEQMARIGYTSSLFLFFAILTTLVSVAILLYTSRNIENDNRIVNEQYFESLKLRNAALNTLHKLTLQLEAIRKEKKEISAKKEPDRAALGTLSGFQNILEPDSAKALAAYKREEEAMAAYKREEEVLQETTLRVREASLTDPTVGYMFLYFGQRVSIVILLEVLTFFFLRSYVGLRKERSGLTEMVISARLKLVAFHLRRELHEPEQVSKLNDFIFGFGPANAPRAATGPVVEGPIELDPNKVLDILAEFIRRGKGS
ncbi:MAG: hypothetical protein ABI599_03065 [Flavobacteriales bacterium]